MDVTSDRISKTPLFTGAAAKVLNLPELLEQVLVNLSFENLFRVQRVNHIFKTVIDSSTSIQEKMWLAPGPEIDLIDNISSVANPLLFDAEIRRFTNIDMVKIIESEQDPHVAQIFIQQVRAGSTT